MAKPYASELARLQETLRWSASTDIESLKNAVKTAGLSPLSAIGSGGSLTAANVLAALHQSFTGKPGLVQTPLEAANANLDVSVSQWLLSAGGSNVDINAAAVSLIEREHRQVAVMCGRPGSPITEICERHPFVDLLLFPPPAGKDGFLATNSLVGFSALLARAYTSVFDPIASWEDVASTVEPFADSSSGRVESWRDAAEVLWGRSTTVVLYGPSTKIGAVDLESKFTEAALGVVQLADYRNFAHGRHHWLAKRGQETAVLAFITDEDRAIAERTLALIPTEIPIAKLEISGQGPAVLLGSLLAALHVTGWAGLARAIDPGQPGVPDFGRKLYHLNFPSKGRKKASEVRAKSANAAIERKTGESIRRLEERKTLSHWQDALATFVGQLQSTTFGGVILDYDGTVVDTRHRFHPARPEIVAELEKIARSDATLAIATGRGVSVRKDLRAVLPEEFWSRVFIGYYNGAMIGTLSDDSVPDGTDEVCPELKDLAEAFATSDELAGSAKQTNRRYQITLEPRQFMAENRLWDIVHQLILRTGCREAIVTRSSHSVDIIASGVSKTNVINQIQERLPGRQILTIGDRGRWPGNDYDLLNAPMGLSVDEVSVDPMTCWNLAEPGQRGVAVTRNYLEALEAVDGGLRFRKGTFR
ncbi:HAD hydrolase family protein [Shinella sp. CPCC 100929]|jgi:hydroxymethylpyrimidine pyrophosphatase-like HAD family hydrolase/fructoselysine-6-P-deglycase FrlB-like protein|uniref:HAD hydrolase family protein n=1 Tax=Shinella lacus TaxID=2654216 RepID=A0ABT1RH76_9HYPH|nr:HAD hydrolase family protein [Shinella lacus]MCQ4634553.1 HAD hydrolase family protein [Shinella lacus]